MNILQRTALTSDWRGPARNSFLTSVFFLCSMLLGGYAQAQQTSVVWREEGSGIEYPTQAQAEAGMRSRGGFYAKMREIKNTVVAENKIAVTYWGGSDSSVFSDWKYSRYLTEPIYTTEQEVINDWLAYYDQKSMADGCTTGAVFLGPTQNLGALVSWSDGASKTEWLAIKIKYQGKGFIFGECVLSETISYAYRDRTRCEDSDRQWNPASNSCEIPNFTAQLSSKPLRCAACSLVGDPVDVTTGDQYETESDFDLGWIKFERYYHSVVSNNAGSFGPGWTHSHAFRLAIMEASEPTIGYIRPNGSHLPFKRIATGNYEATDGSGMRIQASGTNWVLRAPDESITFDAKGRPLVRDFDDGTSLTYVFDAMARLMSITHSSGRVLTFNYANSSSNAPLASITSSDIAVATYGYTTTGQVATVAYPSGGVRRYHYDDSRFPQHLTGIIAENNVRFATFAYDTQGRAICSQQGGGATCDASSPGANRTLLTYTPTGGAAVTDPLGNVSTYGLTADAGGKPRQVNGVADATAGISRTYYDESVDFRRRLDTVTDRNGVQTQHTYAEVTDPLTGQPASVHTIVEAVGTPEARTVVERRDLASNRLVVNQQGNRETRITRNARLQPASVVVKDLVTAQTRTTTYTYCEAADITAGRCPQLGRLRIVDGARTDVTDRTIYSYYTVTNESGCDTPPAGSCRRLGDLYRVTDAVGHTTEFMRYDRLGRVTRIKDANGVLTDYEYTPRGWLTATKMRGTTDTVETDDRITRLEYFPTGLVKKITQPDGPFVTFTYDAAQRLTDVTDNAGNTLHYTLDNAGNRLQEDTRDSTATVKRTLSRIYNQLGQLATQADASANPTDFTYDANGNLETVTDALTRVSDQDVDPLNRLTRTLQDAGAGQINAETKFEYDALDRLTKVTDPKGLDTTYMYNGLGGLTQLSSPDTGTSTSTFDSAGNRKTQLDARGVTTTYGYDALNRLTTVAYSDGTAGITYTYDTGSTPACQRVGATASFTQGRLTRITDVTGYTEYCYNRFGDMVGKSQANPQIFNVRYGYAASGRLQNTTYPDGAVVDYVYDTLSQVTAIGVTPSGGPREVLLRTARYAPFGPVTQWTWNNGRTLQRPVDLDYRTSQVYDSAAGGLSTGYHYDAVGNVDQLWDGMLTTQQAGYAYDALDRLTETKGPTNLPVESYGYDATGNRTSFTNGTGTQAYAYPTTSHQLSSIAGSARSYDLAGNTTTNAATGFQYLYDGAGRMKQSKLNSVVQMNYRYNGKGERTRQFSGDATTTSTYTVYDEQGHWLGDYSATGAAKQQAIWLGDLPVGLLVGSGTSQQLDYIEADHLGTPRVVIDPDRDVAVWKWDAKSEAFGNTTPAQDPDDDDTVFVFDMRFPGQRYDAASGLNYNYFRDYDTRSGRYVQSDPIGLRGGISTYAYVGGNPINYIDPSGLQDSDSGVTRTETGSLTLNLRYYLDRALEALGLPVSAPVAAAVQTGSFYNMQKDNTIGNDKYFHCIANCQSSRAAGEMAACTVAGAREDSQDLIKRHNEDRQADEAANVFGRNGASGDGSCQQQCSQFIVKGINARYLPGGK